MKVAPAQHKLTPTPARSVRATRDAVINAVRRAGEDRLFFTANDIVAHLSAADSSGPASCATVAEVDNTLDGLVNGLLLLVRRPKRQSSAHASPVLRDAVYMLAHRARETADLPQKDSARAVEALRIACRVLGTSRVSTRSVTHILHALPILSFDHRQLTNTVLTSLTKGRNAQVKKQLASERGRDVVWALHDRLATKEFAPWMLDAVKVVVAAKILAKTVVGASSSHHALEMLLHEAIAATKSVRFPEGHPVTVSDIEAIARTNPRVRMHLDAFSASGRPLGPALGDASKSRLHGSQRVRQRIVRLATPEGSQSYYDLPNSVGFVQRAHYPTYIQIIEATRPERVREMRDEILAALRARETANGGPLMAIAAARLAAVTTRINALNDSCIALRAVSGAFGEAVRNTLTKRQETCRDLLMRVPSDDDALQDSATTGNPGEFITADELVILCGEQLPDGLSAAAWASRFKTLAKVRNPLFVSVSAPTARERAKYVYDPVDAAVHLAERASAVSLSFWRSGRTILGPYVRDANLLVPLLESPRYADRAAALAGLAMLGHDAARRDAEALVADGHAREVERAEGLYALRLLGALTQDQAATVMRSAPSSLVLRRAVQATVAAIAAKRRIV